MIKNYKFNYDVNEASCELQVDTDKFTNDLAKASLDFFSWSWDEESNIIDEYMYKVALECIKVATFNSYNVFGVLREFNEGKEGWPILDGSLGIKLIDVKRYEFEDFNLDVNIEEDAQVKDIPKRKYY